MKGRLWITSPVSEDIRMQWRVSHSAGHVQPQARSQVTLTLPVSDANTHMQTLPESGLQPCWHLVVQSGTTVECSGAHASVYSRLPLTSVCLWSQSTAACSLPPVLSQDSADGVKDFIDLSPGFSSCSVTHDISWTYTHDDVSFSVSFHHRAAFLIELWRVDKLTAHVYAPGWEEGHSDAGNLVEDEAVMQLWFITVERRTQTSQFLPRRN